MPPRVLWFVLLIGLIIPFILPGYLLFVITLGGVWAIAAVGLNLLTGYTGQISIGHAGFVSLGAYTSALLTVKGGLPFWLALPVAGLVAGAVGFALGLPALRLSGPYLAIATLGFGVAVGQIAQKWEPLTGGFQGLHPPRPSFGPWTVQSDAALYLLVLAVLALMTWLAANLLNSPYGRAFIALRDSEPAAQAAGISLARHKTLAFALSAFYAGVAGSLYAHLVGFISPPDFGLPVSIFLVSIIVIGGLASLPGSILGAFFLTVLFQRLSGLRDLRSLVYGISLVLIVIFMPGGVARIRLPGRFWPGRKAIQ